MPNLNTFAIYEISGSKSASGWIKDEGAASLEKWQKIPEIETVEDLTGFDFNSLSVFVNFIGRSLVRGLWSEFQHGDLPLSYEIVKTLVRITRLLHLVESYSIPSEYIKQELRVLEQMYTFREPGKVWDYLSANLFLIPFLVEARAKLQGYFPEATFVLQIFTDPEGRDEKLAILAQVDLSPEEALNKLDRLDDEWLLHVPSDILTKVCIDVEFK
ncbi:MAG TPA: hypothetical protein ENG73_11405 [Desulfobacterales bacterium]|nr:hypothetical protein [Desulfobacterales bacterium]